MEANSGHLPDAIHALWYKVYIQCLRNDPQAVAADAENLSRISRERGVELFVMLADLALRWARGRLGDAMSGANELRRSLADYTSQGNLLWVPAFHGFLAELEFGRAKSNARWRRLTRAWRSRRTAGKPTTNPSSTAFAATFC